ncbi:hypothetical protein BUALT_Bualt09G0040800 [Buddleja alternifolia]|uniref:Ankyrin repeat-containing protein n=1 Tax=Buddleja alternifolia TaxID=168488 RepID=A0AAV6X1K2_9LAMI|nr:hypothetical protein BUALT_Bualt09G0040800 [Buddleja alternifolia]
MASSNVNVADFVSVKPTLRYGKKYKLWKEQMLCLVESQGLLGFIDGETPPPPENAAAEEQKVWRRRDRLVKGWILGSVGEDALDAVVGLDTAMDVWLELEKIFSEKADESDNIDESQSSGTDSSEEEWGPSEVEVESSSPSAEHWHRRGGSEADTESSPPTPHGKGFNWNLALYRAALKGDWDTAEKMFQIDKDETKAIISSRLETVLHVSVGTGKANNFVRRLIEWMPNEALGMKDFEGDTALHYAARVGNKEAAIILVNREPNLQYITNKKDRLPVQLAAIYSHKDTLMYFISMSRPDVERSPFVGELGVRLLIAVIASQFLDVALDLVGNYPDLGTLENDGYSALATISGMNSAFPCGESFNWWQSLIYSCIPLKLSISRSDNTRSIAGDIENHSINAPMYIKSSWFDVTCGRIIPQVKGIAHKKLIHQQALELVKCLCRKLESLPHQQASTIYNHSIILAARVGIHEVVEVIIEMFPTSIFTDDSKTDSNIFLLAARNRFENVFNLIYRMSERKQQFYDSVDSCGNSLMHLCAKLGPPHKLNLVPGAALQMQREIQWFKV